tara:strand:+ start:865 stop:1077 length:213 start_codon:yes stop_codon:yes gene_type:complete
MYKKQGYMQGGYGSNVSPMDIKNKNMMDDQMRTPKAMGGMHMSKKGNASIAAMEEACASMAGKNASVSYK